VGLRVKVVRSEQIPGCLGWAKVWLSAARQGDQGDWTIELALSRMVMQELFGLAPGEWPAQGSAYRLRLDLVPGEG
jgi:hypothetical protein